jgi:hypothetical protein
MRLRSDTLQRMFSNIESVHVTIVDGDCREKCSIRTPEVDR